ncbi:hypothetical protein IHE45_18G028600 [Dioscorea alata]|uniref:Uncharacterized protein n=1 Tax=Dioscorea alata TaxID=55571 RepID=A0ACB7U5Z4_DIOAL|nr:hypothetical protein IHE45_18G028600 [Dioscorea alata]
MYLLLVLLDVRYPIVYKEEVGFWSLVFYWNLRFFSSRIWYLGLCEAECRFVEFLLYQNLRFVSSRIWYLMKGVSF